MEVNLQEKPIDVLLAEDHAIFRTGIRNLLLEQGNMRVVAEVETGDAAVEQALELSPRVVTMDIRMPGKDGIQATREIRTERPDTRVLIISAVEDEEHVIAALEAGATGYLVKDDDPTSMVRAVETVSAQRLYLGPSLANRTLQRVASAYEADLPFPTPSSSLCRLTQREIEIVRYLAHGRRGREIAFALGISERTVRNHLANVFAKLRVRDRTQLMLYAIRTGLVRV